MAYVYDDSGEYLGVYDVVYAAFLVKKNDGYTFVEIDG